MSDELHELSPEEKAMQMVLSILRDNGPPHSTREILPEEVKIAEDDDPHTGAGESQLPDMLRPISNRNEIPIIEKHVLVMWGLSTYRFDHPRGVTFIVDNSRNNGARDQQYRTAITAATELAQAQGLPFVYVLE